MPAADIPAEVTDLLRGDTAGDGWEPAFHLLTTGPDGYPQVCLLSRAELEAGTAPGAGAGLLAGGGVIRCVVRARRTAANLRRTGRALLAVVGGQTVYYLRLRVTTVLEEDDGRTLAATFAVDGGEDDTLGIPLQPMMFRSSSYVRDRERWDDNRALLRRLAAAGG